MKHLIAFTVLLLAVQIGFAQYRVAYFDNPMSHEVKEADVPYLQGIRKSGDTLAQLDGWPRSFVANPTFRNFRGVTLEYIDENAGHEIIVGANDSLFVLRGNGTILWSLKLNGTAIYPASTGDIDNDGEVDIVVVTGGVPYNGHVYAFNSNGSIKTGWPKTVPSCWFLCAPVLCDLDGDNNMEIIVCEMNTSQPTANRKRLHIFNHDGSNFSEDWPKSLPATPAVTPAVADVNSDGSPDILVCTVDSIYLLDLQANPIPPFPMSLPGMKFSYQSPLIIDYRSSPYDSPVEIIGANHGDNPGFYKIWFNYDPPVFAHWPTDGGVWTYSPPMAYGGQTIMQYEMISQPLSDYENGDSCVYNMAWSFDSSDELSVDVVRYDGLEGFMSLSTSGMDLLYTGSNMNDQYGNGFLHIYDIANYPVTELEGFPVKVKGSTFMNGVNLGDVNGDGFVDMVVLGYSDSVYINVIETSSIAGLQYPPYNSPDLLVPCYRGSNTRVGRTEPVTYENAENIQQKNPAVYPNPVIDKFYVRLPRDMQHCTLKMYDITGKCVLSTQLDSERPLDASALGSGIYFVSLNQPEAGFYHVQKILISR